MAPAPIKRNQNSKLFVFVRKHQLNLDLLDKKATLNPVSLSALIMLTIISSKHHIIHKIQDRINEDSVDTPTVF